MKHLNAISVGVAYFAALTCSLITHPLTHGTEPFLRSRQLCSYWRTSLHGTWKFITMFTRALHWSICWARSIQAIPSHPISIGSILLLSTHLRLGLPSGLCPSGFPTNILHAFLFSPMWCNYCVVIYLFFHNKSILIFKYFGNNWIFRTSRNSKHICFILFRKNIVIMTNVLRHFIGWVAPDGNPYFWETSALMCVCLWSPLNFNTSMDIIAACHFPCTADLWMRAYYYEFKRLQMAAFGVYSEQSYRSL
jgi:hypothetical protein